MREILFRGKRKDNGEWVEGYLLKGISYLNDEKIIAIASLDLMFFLVAKYPPITRLFPKQ